MFLVYLKGEDEPVKIDAERVSPKDRVLLFSNGVSDPANAAVPLDNVWYVVKEKKKE